LGTSIVGYAHHDMAEKAVMIHYRYLMLYVDN